MTPTPFDFTVGRNSQPPASLSKSYERLWFEQDGQEREYFNLVRDLFNRDQHPSIFLPFGQMCQGCDSLQSNGEFNNTPDNRRKGAKPRK